MKRTRFRMRPAAWLLLLPVLLSTGTVQGDSVDLASYRPERGVVFDGVATAQRSWYVDFSERGFVLEHLVPFFLCPGSPRDGVDEVLRFAPDQRVFQNATVVAPFEGFRLLVRLDLPPDLGALHDDCDLLDEFEAVQDFLQEVTHRSTSIRTQIDVALDALRDAYCDARAAILDAPIVTGEEQGIFPPLGGGGGGSSSGPAPAPCSQFRSRLDALVALADAMSAKRALFTPLLDLMEGVPDYVAQRTFDFGGLTLVEQQYALAGIDTWLTAGEHLRDEAALLGSEIASKVSSFTLEAVSLSCDGCPSQAASAASLSAGTDPSFAGDAGRDASEAILIRRDREPLTRYVELLWRSVRQAEDHREACRLAALALRLGCLPSRRVLHVTWRGTAAIGHEYVALRSPRGHRSAGPLGAVVLTVLPAEAPLPDPTPADQGRLLDAIDAFNAMLAPVEEDDAASHPRRSRRPHRSRGRAR